MFAPTAIQDISTPTIGSLDTLPKAFTAWESYSTIPTGSTFVTQSYSASPFAASGGSFWTYAPNNKIYGVNETATNAWVWDINTNVMSSAIALTGLDVSIRNILYDSTNNLIVVLGSTKWTTINPNTNTAEGVVYTVPTNTGTQYASAVVWNGIVYCMPLVNTSAATKIVKIDVKNRTSSLIAGSGNYNGGIFGRWGAVVGANGKIYFSAENGNTGYSFIELDPATDTVTPFGTVSCTGMGYTLSNLPDGRIFFSVIQTATGNYFTLDPYTRVITTIGARPTTFDTMFVGTTIAQNGLYYGLTTTTAAANKSGIYAFNPRTNAFFKTQYSVPNTTTSTRGYQDLISLPDGRLVCTPGANNTAGNVVTYYNILQNPSPNLVGVNDISIPIKLGGAGI